MVILTPHEFIFHLLSFMPIMGIKVVLLYLRIWWPLSQQHVLENSAWMLPVAIDDCFEYFVTLGQTPCVQVSLSLCRMKGLIVGSGSWQRCLRRSHCHPHAGKLGHCGSTGSRMKQRHTGNKSSKPNMWAQMLYLVICVINRVLVLAKNINSWIVTHLIRPMINEWVNVSMYMDGFIFFNMSNNSSQKCTNFTWGTHSTISEFRFLDIACEIYLLNIRTFNIHIIFNEDNNHY